MQRERESQGQQFLSVTTWEHVKAAYDIGENTYFASDPQQLEYGIPKESERWHYQRRPETLWANTVCRS